MSRGARSGGRPAQRIRKPPVPTCAGLSGRNRLPYNRLAADADRFSRYNSRLSHWRSRLSCHRSRVSGPSSRFSGYRSRVSGRDPHVMNRRSLVACQHSPVTRVGSRVIEHHSSMIREGRSRSGRHCSIRGPLGRPDLAPYRRTSVPCRRTFTSPSPKSKMMPSVLLMVIVSPERLTLMSVPSTSPVSVSVRPSRSV